MNCIFCETENEAISVEHIVSESLGNKHYMMQKGTVCDSCNGKFSNFEGTALINSIYIMERARFGIETKKGKNVKGKVNELIIEGDKEFRKNYLNVTGLNEKNFKNFDPKTKIGQLVIASFDKSEVAVSKLVLKIGLESLFKSRKKEFSNYNFKELKDYLTNKNNNDWPFLVTDIELEKFSSVPKFLDKHRLNQNHCTLRFLEQDEETLLFKFKYGSVPITLNLLNRNLNWIKDYMENDSKATLNPVHFKNKLAKLNKP